jgi:hypothetical protein
VAAVPEELASMGLRWGELPIDMHLGGSEGGRVTRVNISLHAGLLCELNALIDLLRPKQCWHIVRVPKYTFNSLHSCGQRYALD